jgi:hypothetical protein
MRATRSSLLTRLGSAGAVVVLATGGVMVTATAANAAKGHPKAQETRLSIRNKAVAHGRHHVDQISGVLTSHRKGVASETITLDARSGKKPRWTAVASGTTAAAGSVTFTVTPTAKTQFKLVFAGDSTYRKSQSNVVTLKVVKSK